MTDGTGTQLTIRLATESDALLLARFRYDFRASLSQACESEADFVQRCERWMQERLREESGWRCWLAEQDRRPVGHLWLQFIEKIPNPIVEPKHHAYVTNFYVRAEARGCGIGSSLLEAALAWSKAQDVQAVILWPTEQSRPLYLRHGFAVRDDLLELVLTQREEKP
jgi:GNAT superfamily N-acetyltransferase